MEDRRNGLVGDDDAMGLIVERQSLRLVQLRGRLLEEGVRLGVAVAEDVERAVSAELLRQPVLGVSVVGEPAQPGHLEVAFEVAVVEGALFDCIDVDVDAQVLFELLLDELRRQVVGRVGENGKRDIREALAVRVAGL